MRTVSRTLTALGSLIFAGAVALAVFASLRTDGLVMWVKDGTPVFFKDSTGSIAGQDEYLFFVVLWLPSALIRLVRTPSRPALLEILLFGITAVFVYVGFSSVGSETFRLTLATTGEPWIATWLAATGTASLSFLLLCTGWIPYEGAKA